MEQFPHLQFVQKVAGRPRLRGFGEENEISRRNKENRRGHSGALFAKSENIRKTWEKDFSLREENGLGVIDRDVVPVFIQINPDLFIDPEFDLQKFGIEIISEESEGFIIGASLDNLKALEDKIKDFIENKHGSARIAEFWNIIDGNRSEWKPKHILSENLLSNWANIIDDSDYNVEVGIAFDRPLGPQPDPTKQGGGKRLEAYIQKQIARDEALMNRQNHFEKFISHYGELKSDYIDLDDSFSCEIKISGKGLKDLVINYQFVFEVNEIDSIGGIEGDFFETGDCSLEILAPDETSAVVGVIDSGIMENHKYLEAAIDGNSKCYLTGNLSVADEVQGGGHGTKVAGAILYPLGVSSHTSPYQLPCFIRNLRVLDQNNYLSHSYPAQLIKDIVEDNPDCSIFNLSITSSSSHRKKHMSTWAALIDTIINEKDILFIISAGNLLRNSIQHYIKNGENYPQYLNNPYCKVANPAQSSFAISVGSINHAAFGDDSWESIGNDNDISAFSRVGPGIWNTVKPDVVEYGGGYVISKNGLFQIRANETTAPELLRSTLHGGSAYGNDSVGTSFSTPKVTSIVAKLKKLYPVENVNLLRALVIQGARLPREYFQSPTLNSIQHFGYGIPSLERVTKNTEHRITFYNTNYIKAEEGHIYSLKIPDELKDPGNEYDILIEVTLAYSGKVRRTRQKTKSYLSTWLDWQSCYLNESLEQFETRALREINGEGIEHGSNGGDSIQWKIRENNEWGSVKGLNRNNNTAQKDWVLLKSYELPDELSFCIRGHKGWDKNHEEVPYALTVSIEILGANIPIYDLIRVENEIEIPIGT